MGKISIGDAIIYDDSGGGGQKLINQIPGIFASSVYSDGYTMDRVTDDSTSTFWSASGSIGQFIGIDYKISVKVTKLFIVDNQDRLKDFVFEGSNAKTSGYVTLYTGTRPTGTDEKSFEIPNENYYRYYRVRCSGALYAGSNFGMANLRMEYVYQPD